MASSGNYRLNLVWVSHGEQLRADLNALQSKLSGVTQEAGRGQRQMGLWGNQMKAIGTTIRYAFAASIVYSVATAITSLGEFEAKMGEIDSLAADMKDGNLVGLGDRLNWLGDQAITMSNKYGIAVNSIQDQMRAFFSSGFTGANPTAAAGWADILAQIQLITEGADPAKMAVGVAGLTQATGGGGTPVTSAKRIRDIIAVVLRGSTAFRGEDIARDIGKLSGAGPALNMTPEQIFAVYGTAGKVGGSGAVIGRGITQLLTASLANPKSKSQKEAFAALGLPTDPGALRQMGGMNILMKLLQGIGPIKPSARAVLGNEGLSDEEALATPGLPTARIGLLYKAIGRMESVRQILSIASVGGADEIQKFMDAITDGEKQERGRQQAAIVNDKRWYQQMSEAQKNARMTIMKGFEFALKPAAHAVKSVSDEINRHQRATTLAVGGAAAAGLFMRFFAGSSISGAVLSRIPGLRGITGGQVKRGTDLATAVALGSGTAAFTSQGTGKRSDPLWVIIDPLSWFFPGAPSGTMGGPDKNKPTTRPPFIPAWLRRNAPRVGGIGLATAGAAAFDVAALGSLLLMGGGDSGFMSHRASQLTKAAQGHPALRNAITYYAKALHERDPARQRAEMHSPLFAAVNSAIDQWGGVNTNKMFASLIALERANRRPGGHAGISGAADITIRLEPADALKKTVKGQTLGVKVPLGTGNAPQHRGKKAVQVGAAAGVSVR